MTPSGSVTNVHERPPLVDKPGAASIVADRVDAADLEFVAYAHSQWHALGVAAAIESRELEHGVVLIGPIPGDHDDPHISTEKFATVPARNLAFYRVGRNENGIVPPSDHLRFTLGMLNTLLLNRDGSGEPFPIISPLEPAPWLLRSFANPSRLRGRRVEWVTIDEGLGTYVSQEQRDAMAERERQRRGGHQRLFRTRLRDALAPNLNDRLESRVVRRVQTDDRSLFRMDRDKLVLQTSVAADYAAILPDRTEHRDGFVLLATQPLSEGDKIEADVERDIVDRAVTQLSEAGYDVGLKPHPREEATKYDYVRDKVELVTTDEPVEYTLSGSSPAALVGFTTTALLTGSTICDVPAYTFARQVRGQSGNERYRRVCSNFEQWASQYVRPFDEFISGSM